MWAELNKLASEKNMTQFKIFNLNKFFSEVAIVAANKICTCKKQLLFSCNFLDHFF